MPFPSPLPKACLSHTQCFITHTRERLEWRVEDFRWKNRTNQSWVDNKPTNLFSDEPSAWALFCYICILTSDQINEGRTGNRDLVFPLLVSSRVFTKWNLLVSFFRYHNLCLTRIRVPLLRGLTVRSPAQLDHDNVSLCKTLTHSLCDCPDGQVALCLQWVNECEWANDDI